jgi:hypothetical protein
MGMSMLKTMKTLAALSAFALVTACGGGGGGGGSSGPVASTNTFNIQSGYAALISAGYSKAFNITGTCTGTFTITAGAATTATTFEGASALSGAEVGSYSWTGCTPTSGSTTITRYYDSNYIPKGYQIVGGDYALYAVAPSIPSTARVGDVVVVGTLNKYSNSTKSTSTGHQDTTLVMEADTATTAIANIISKNYNASNTLTSTEQDRYRVAADGSMTALSLDVQYANGSTVHIIGN